MAILAVITTALLFLWGLMRDWLLIFIAPIKNLEMLWIIIPIWISWFFSEFFQEKKGTSFGNAISNGAVPMIIGVDWARYLTRMLNEGNLVFNAGLVVKYLLCFLVILYGLTIILFGIKGKGFVQFYGRVREVTYVLVIFSPVIYGIIGLSWRFFLVVLLFFPLFYYLIELIDKVTPNPKVYDLDEEKEKESFGMETPGGAGGGSSLGDFDKGFDDKAFEKSLGKDFKNFKL